MKCHSKKCFSSCYTRLFCSNLSTFSVIGNAPPPPPPPLIASQANGTDNKGQHCECVLSLLATRYFHKSHNILFKASVGKVVPFFSTDFTSKYHGLQTAKYFLLSTKPNVVNNPRCLMVSRVTFFEIFLSIVCIFCTILTDFIPQMRKDYCVLGGFRSSLSKSEYRKADIIVKTTL